MAQELLSLGEDLHDRDFLSHFYFSPSVTLSIETARTPSGDTVNRDSAIISDFGGPRMNVWRIRE